MLGLEIAWQHQTVNLGRLLLVSGLGPLKRFGGWGLTEASCFLFDRILEVMKHESR